MASLRRRVEHRSRPAVSPSIVPSFNGWIDLPSCPPPAFTRAAGTFLLVNSDTCRHDPFQQRQRQSLLSGVRRFLQVRADMMDLTKILAQLRQERERIDRAILSLEPLAGCRGRKRGRPPGGMSETNGRGGPPGSESKAPRAAATRGGT